MNRYLWFSDLRFWGLLSPFLVLELVLKGIALWRAARNRQKYWFIALLVINSLGIVPAIYLLTNKEKKVKTSKN